MIPRTQKEAEALQKQVDAWVKDGIERMGWTFKEVLSRNVVDERTMHWKFYFYTGPYSILSIVEDMLRFREYWDKKGQIMEVKQIRSDSGRTLIGMNINLEDFRGYQ